jgi:Protein of unknown function (DUF2815)
MKVKLSNVRLSFPELWTPTQFEGKGAFAYKTAFLFEKGSENHKALLKAEKEVAVEEWKAKADAILEAANDDSKLRFIRKGDSKEYDGYAGMLFIHASRDKKKGRPLILDQKPKKADGSDNLLTEDDGRPYAGCYVNATLELWAQNNVFGKTVRAQLLAVQFSKDGDAFSAGTKGSSDEFEDLSETGESDDLIDE